MGLQPARGLQEEGPDSFRTGRPFWAWERRAVSTAEVRGPLKVLPRPTADGANAERGTASHVRLGPAVPEPLQFSSQVLHLGESAR